MRLKLLLFFFLFQDCNGIPEYGYRKRNNFGDLVYIKYPSEICYELTFSPIIINYVSHDGKKFNLAGDTLLSQNRQTFETIPIVKKYKKKVIISYFRKFFFLFCDNKTNNNIRKK